MKCELVLCSGADVDGLMTGTTKLPLPLAAALFSDTNFGSGDEVLDVFDVNAGKVSGRAMYT